MINRFVELPATHNVLSETGMSDVLSVLEKMSSGDAAFNLAAAGLMEVAHDLHAHGSAQESLLAEHVIAGIARGLKIAVEAEKKYKRCPHCGRRHA